MIAWVLVAAACVPLWITLINLSTWRPVTRGVPVGGGFSACVPARNEEANIGRCVRALLAEPFDEVLVLDDHSTDHTAAILASIEDPRLRVLPGRPLPPGWVGKPNACAQLGQAARGSTLVFVDADVAFEAGGLGRLAACLERSDVVTALPRQVVRTAGEALAIAQLLLTYQSWLPLRLVRWSRDPRVLAANGQILAIRREAYDRIGGFATVATAVVDDMALCRTAKEAGATVDFVDGARIASCRMYTSGGDALAGFSKNLYEGIGGSTPALLGLAAVHLACFVVPWLAWPWMPVVLAGVAANLLQRALIAWRYRLPAWTVPAHLPGIAALLGVAWRSRAWAKAGRIRWRGRTYAALADRAAERP